jgi:hypothetical protein
MGMAESDFPLINKTGNFSGRQSFFKPIVLDEIEK